MDPDRARQVRGYRGTALLVFAPAQGGVTSAALADASYRLEAEVEAGNRTVAAVKFIAANEM